MKNFKLFKKFKPAFTMIELVFVIVVLGILSSLAMPDFENEHTQEAADSILSHIRYTQHLALTDNKHMFNDREWQQKFWRIVFGSCTGTNRYFMIGSDESMDNANNGYFQKEEAAIDPQTGKPYFWTNGADCSNGGDGTVSNDIFISKKYGVTEVIPSGSCTGQNHIGFDNMGRPHHKFSASIQPNYASVISNNKGECIFTFTMSNDDTFAISIQPETGYAQIVGQPNS